MKEKVLIVGGGYIAWSCAFRLAKSGLLSADQIVVIDDESNQDDSLCAVLPSYVTWLGLMGMNDKDFVRNTLSSYYLGVNYQTPSGLSQTTAHSEYGFVIDDVPFLQQYQALAGNNDLGSIEGYSIAAVAAKNNRFAHPSEDPKSLFSKLNYSLVINTKHACEFLKNACQELGVQLRTANIENIIFSDNGVDRVLLENGEDIPIDLLYWAAKKNYAEFPAWTPALDINSISTHKSQIKDYGSANALLLCSDDSIAITLSANKQAYTTTIQFNKEPELKSKSQLKMRESLYQGNIVFMGEAALEKVDGYPGYLDINALIVESSLHLLEHGTTQQSLHRYLNENVSREMHDYWDYLNLLMRTCLIQARSERIKQINFSEELQHRLAVFQWRTNQPQTERQLFVAHYWNALMHFIFRANSRSSPLLPEKNPVLLAQLMKIKEISLQAALTLPDFNQYLSKYIFKHPM